MLCANLPYANIAPSAAPTGVFTARWQISSLSIFAIPTTCGCFAGLVWSKQSNMLISLSGDKACVWLVPPAGSKTPSQPAAVQIPIASLQILASLTAQQLAASVSHADSGKPGLSVMPASAALLQEQTGLWQAWLPIASSHIAHLTQSVPGRTPANKSKLQPVNCLLQHHKVCHLHASPHKLLDYALSMLAVFGSLSHLWQ